MRAARQTVALLGLTRQVERSRAVLPEDLVSVVDKGALLKRVGQILRDASPAVRAQALDALGSVKLDESILKLLGPVVEDSSPLVRLRMAELIGASRTAGQETLVDYFAGDEDELVQAMARALQGKSGIGR
jgi:HEAT repeat protein